MASTPDPLELAQKVAASFLGDEAAAPSLAHPDELNDFLGYIFLDAGTAGQTLSPAAQDCVGALAERAGVRRGTSPDEIRKALSAYRAAHPPSAELKKAFERAMEREVSASRRTQADEFSK